MPDRSVRRGAADDALARSRNAMEAITVLVVEPNVLFRNALVGFLSDLGHES